MAIFNKQSAQCAPGYAGSYHELWVDNQGHKMLGCTSKRGPGVSINWHALQSFRQEGGQFVGLRCPDFKIIVPVEKLDGIQPYPGCDYIVVSKHSLDGTCPY